MCGGSGQIPTTVVVNQLANPDFGVTNVNGVRSLVIGVDLTFTFLDQNGNPVSDAVVGESVVDSSGQNVTQASDPIPLTANGQARDIVTNNSGPVPTNQAGEVNALNTFNANFTTNQTVTLTVTTSTGRTVQVTQQRTLTNNTSGAPPLAGGRIRGYTFTMDKPKIEIIR
jgi:hypothetical protein